MTNKATAFKPKSPWGDAHITLKRLWDERVAPTGMSQEEFGERYGIGSQGMVSQYLLGTRPLNYDSAAKFAKGFDCTIYEICPDMARTIHKEIIPVLGRRLRRRVSMLAFAYLAGHSLFAPTNSHASPAFVITFAEYALATYRRLRALLSALSLHPVVD